jgi:hypothetical protein
MAKSSLRRLVLALALVTVAFLLVHTGFFAVKSPPPAPPAPTPAAAPPAPPAPPAETPAPAAAGGRNGQMRLADKPETYAPTPPADADYSYSLKKQDNRRVILPGVSYVPGQGIDIKTSGKDATVQIKRDSTYDYQVMWQKKY